MKAMWAGVLFLVAGAVAAAAVTLGHPPGQVDPAGHAYVTGPVAAAPVLASTPTPVAAARPVATEAPAPMAAAQPAVVAPARAAVVAPQRVAPPKPTSGDHHVDQSSHQRD